MKHLHWMAVAALAFSGFAGSGVHAEPILLDRRTIHTERGLRLNDAAPSAGLKIVQFDSAPSPAQRRAFVQETGARIVHALPRHALLVWMPDGAASRSFDSNAMSRHRLSRVTDFAASDRIPVAFDADRASRRPANYMLTFYTGEGRALVADLEWLASQRGVTFTGDAMFDLLPDRVIVPVEAPGGMLDAIAARPTLLAVTRLGELHTAGEASALGVANVVKQVDGRTVPLSPVEDGVTYLGWLEDQLAGGGFDPTNPRNYPVVAVVDTGIDNGIAADPLSDDLRELGAAEMPSRIAFGFEWNFASNEPDSTVLPGDNHGHAVASILAGFNISTTSDFADTATGFRYGVGVSPYGRIGNVRWRFAPFVTPMPLFPLSLNGTIVNAYERIHTLAADTPSKAAISNNSWTIVRPGEGCVAPQDNATLSVYDVIAQVVDARTRDAVPDHWETVAFNAHDTPGYEPRFEGRQEMLFVFPAGNSGYKMADFDYCICQTGGPANQTLCRPVPRMNTVPDPALAKNTLVVGGTESFDHVQRVPATCPNPNGCCVPAMTGDLSYTNNLNDGAFFSSKGTAFAGERTKPDIMAPAIGAFGNVLAAEAELLCSEDDPGVIVNAPPYPIYKRIPPGTSFASPHVAGTAQLTAVHLAQVHGITHPSAALLKAWLINGALFMTGDQTGPYGEDGVMTATADLPSSYQGFGRVNLGAALNRDVPRHLINQSHVFTNTGAPFEIEGTIAQAGEPLLVTLAWSDCFAEAAAPKWQNLVNDLDLYVIVGSGAEAAHFTGNNMAGDASRAVKVTVRAEKPMLAARRRLEARTPSSLFDQLRASGDMANNVEKVAVRTALPAGTPVRIAIYPWSLNGDALDQDPAAAPRQDFALVAHNFAAVKR